ncbi:MAG: long-chain-acyl-CoA synthetase, partial [Brevundimonas sp.]
MGLVANIRRDLRFVKGLRLLLGRIKPITMDSVDLVCDDWEEAVDKFADHIAIQDDRRSISYRDLDAMANRFGHWAVSRRLKRGDTVALVMQNRAEYIAAWMGFSKVGVGTALINTNLTGHALAHCLTISNASQVVTDEDCWGKVEDARPLVDRNMMLWVLGLADEDEADERRGLDKPVRGGSSVRPARSVRSGLTN